MRAPRAWLFGDLHGSDELRGLVYISDTGIVLPTLDDLTALDDLLEIVRRNTNAFRVIVGERNVLQDMWDRMRPLGFRARISRDQLGYVIGQNELTETCDRPLVRASGSELDEVVAASAAMALEEAKDDPQSRNPSLFRARIRERLARGRDFVFVERGLLQFKCNVSALSRIGGQIEGIYTPPERRRRGLGRQGTAAITAWVLERAARAFLLVNDDNLVARGLYEKLGYRRVSENRTIFVE